ncbi:hypothetical protein HG531_007182 [Fusarium graminearum]|nr:hypothetical protein HG531_007182 [Fusarium graminearum]
MVSFSWARSLRFRRMRMNLANHARAAVRSPNEADVHDHGNHADSNGLLLLCLTTDRTAPTKDKTVDGVSTDGEDYHADVAACCVHGGSSGSETDNGDGLGSGDVPGSLVVATGHPGDEDSACASDEVRRASKDESDSSVKAKSLDDGREEVLETVGSQMEMSHGTEDPDKRVLGSLLQTLHGASLTLVADSIEFHTVVGQLSLLLSQPSGSKREIGKDEVSDNSDDKSDSTLKDEEPLPASNTSDIIKTVEDTSGDETGKGSCENVSGVENGDSCGDFLSCVEDGEEVDGTGVVRSFGETEEEAGEEETLVVFGDGGESADYSPEHHHDTLEDVSVSFDGTSQRNVPCSDWGEFGSFEVEIFFKIIQSSQSNGISIKIVEPVHAPKHRHHPSVKLLDQCDFLGVCLLMGTRVICLFIRGDRLLWVLILEDLRLGISVDVGLFITVVLGHDGEELE